MMNPIRKIINDALDKQDEKGISKYGHSILDCPADKYDWNIMTIEELVDGINYIAKENYELKKNSLVVSEAKKNEIFEEHRRERSKAIGFDYHDGICYGIEFVLNRLGIKIEGINKEG